MKNSQNSLTFRGQHDGEGVVLFIRRHPWALARQAFWVALGLALLILVFIYLQASRPAVWALTIFGPIILLYALHAWYLWWNNMYLITSERVLVIAHKALWSRRIEEYSLDKIQALSSVTHGIASATMNFGSVKMAIIGVKEPVELPYIEDAYAVQEQINQAIKKMTHSTVEVHDYRRERPAESEPVKKGRQLTIKK